MEERRKGYPVRKTFKLRLSVFITTVTLILFLLLTFILSIFYQWLYIKRGFLVLGQTGEFLSSAIQNAIASLLIVLAVFIVGIYILVLYVAKRFTGPILRMEKHVKELPRKGAEPLRFRSNDEPILHSIAEGINSLVKRLEIYESLLKEMALYIEKGEGNKEEIIKKVEAAIEK